MKKQYYCAICHKEIKRNYRLVMQQWGLGRFGDFGNKDHYDFCNDCFKVFAHWITKHKEK